MVERGETDRPHARGFDGFRCALPSYDFPNLPLDNYVNQNYFTPSPRRHEGRCAIVTQRGTGCDGRLPRQCDANRADENAAAYGEVVWSWRRDPGVYPCRPVLAGQR